MSVTEETLQISDRMRRDVLALTDAQVLELVIAWTQSWDELRGEYEAAITDLLNSAKDGRVSQSKVRRSTRLRKALEVTRTNLERLAEQTNLTVTATLPEVVALGGAGQVDLITSQLPPGQSGVTVAWDRVSAEAIEAIVERTTERIHASTLSLPSDIEQMMKRQLVRGLAAGDNPRATARRIVKQAEGRFNGGLTRAMTIARTETLDAFRNGSHLAAQENKELLSGWRWSADLSARTCPSCLANHGTMHPVEEPGPLDHPNGRCARIDVTKSWRELGFEIEEPEDIFPDAKQWFENLTPGTQREIMGQKRLDLLQSGEIGWDDLTVQKDNADWRPSMQVRPLKDLN